MHPSNAFAFATMTLLFLWLMRLKISFVCFVLLFLAGCSSLHKKAGELMEEKVYDEAQKVYLEILRGDPKDTKALIGLKKAREGSIGARLIEVRQQRFGGNMTEAAELLRDILINIKTWQVYPSGAVAFTQGEETDFAVRDLEAESRIALSQDHPLRVAFFLARYQDFFQEKRLKIFQNLRAAASQMGLEKCRKGLGSTRKDLSYYREFLANTCIFWGDKQPELKKPVSHGLYNRVATQIQLDELPEQLKTRLENETQTAFQYSPWYDAAGAGPLTLSISGRYSFQTGRKPAVFTHAYEQVEPYSSTELVEKHRSVPVKTTKNFATPDGKTGTETTTEYRDETYTQLETITRTRTVTYHFNYDGTEIEQNLTLQTAAKARLVGLSEPVTLTATVNDRNLTAESQTNIPSKQLYARTAVIRNENEWFQAQMEAWRKQNLEQLRDLWVRNFCQPFQANADVTQQGDRVFQCLRERNRPTPPFADSWLEQHEGVNTSELNQVLK
jgi:hypothetical protein